MEQNGGGGDVYGRVGAHHVLGFKLFATDGSSIELLVC